jgi:hypothetical protein
MFLSCDRVTNLSYICEALVLNSGVNVGSSASGASSSTVTAFALGYRGKPRKTRISRKKTEDLNLRRMPSSGMWRGIGLVRTDVSEEGVTSIFKVEKS